MKTKFEEKLFLLQFYKMKINVPLFFTVKIANVYKILKGSHLKMRCSQSFNRSFMS